jgi:NADPH:quinone reductase-like Zn-dependent oxidoreductase
LVTVVSTAEESTDPRVKKAFFIMERNQRQLVEIGGLLDAGKLRTIIDTVIPLSEAPAAYAGGVQRNGRGKVVVAVSVDQAVAHLGG